jgi:hypothetical protein
MSRKLVLLGITLLVAVGATAASASATAFHFEASSNVLTGEQPGYTSIFTFSTKTVTCDSGQLTGTAVGKTTSSIRVHPRFGASEKCTYGGFEIPVKTSGCDAVLGAEQKVFEGFLHSPFAIECEAGKVIVIELPATCKLEFGSQQVYGVAYKNEGMGTTRDVKALITTKGITYVAKGVGCPIVYGLTNGGTYNDMAYTAIWTVKAYEAIGEKAEEGKQVGVWFE